MRFVLAEAGMDFDFPNMGNRFVESLLVTVFGVAVVFIMLFILVLFIEAFHKVLELSKRENKKSKKAVPVQTAIVSQEQVNVKTDEEPDEAEIAAIVSAVAMCSGMSEKQFVLRGIRRKKESSWRSVI
ncbi:MAG: OadG family protein [Clostridiales bacterium]|nr:OadG family protein [Clostridiales bacterium]